MEPAVDDQTMLSATFMPEPDTVVEESDDELLVYNPRTEGTVYLNGTAALIWRLLDGRRNGEEIVGMLVSAYPDAADRVRGDTLTALQDFVARGIARRA